MFDPKSMIDALVAYGALEIDALDADSGEVIYKFTEKLRDVFPALYDEISDQIYKGAMSLWEKKLVDVNLLDEKPSVALTNFGSHRENWGSRSEGELSMMNTLMKSAGEGR